MNASVTAHLVELPLVRQALDRSAIFVGALAHNFPCCRGVWDPLCPLVVGDYGVGEAHLTPLESKKRLPRETPRYRKVTTGTREHLTKETGARYGAAVRRNTVSPNSSTSERVTRMTPFAKVTKEVLRHAKKYVRRLPGIVTTL